ncbi:MAG: dockerin type I repeat-containing protein [Planctomycetota bacterium]
MLPGGGPSSTVYFSPNRGQLADGVLFAGECKSGRVYVRNNDLIFNFLTHKGERPAEPWRYGRPGRNRKDAVWHTVPLQFVGASATAAIGVGELSHTSNYFVGRDKSKWLTGIPHYDSVICPNLYPDIDLQIRLTGQRFEYDVIARPGADLRAVQLRFPDRYSLEIRPDGSMVANTGLGEFVQEAPVVFQMIDGKRELIRARFKLSGPTTFGFELIDSYDETRPLVVDPVVSYATFIGGTDLESGHAGYGDPTVAQFPNGGFVFAVTTRSDDFSQPALPYMPFEKTLNKMEITELVVLVSVEPCVGPGVGGLTGFTYFGGDQVMDSMTTLIGAYELAIGPNDAIYMSGTTESNTLPVHRALQDTKHSPNAVSGFVVKFADLTDLEFCTYVGGNSSDTCMPMSLFQPAAGPLRIYLAGHSDSTANLPVPPAGSYDSILPLPSTQRAFLYVFEENTDPLQDALSVAYHTYFGGKMKPAGVSAALTVAYGMDVASTGEVFIVGTTNMEDFPTQANPSTAGSPWKDQQGPLPPAGEQFGEFANEAYVIKLAPNNGGSSDFKGATYLGGNRPGNSGLEYAFGIYAASHQEALISGVTPATDFPTKNALPGQDVLVPNNELQYHAFALRLKSDFTDVHFSTYLTGSDLTPNPESNKFEWSYGVHSYTSSKIVVTGATNAEDFPTSCGSAEYCQTVYQGGSLDGFVSILNWDGSNLTLDYSTYIGGSGEDRIFNSQLDGDTLLLAGLTQSANLPVNAPDAYQATHADPPSYDGFVYQLDLSDTDNPFLRGDANHDGGVNIADALYIFDILFAMAPVQCEDACDANDDGSINIADALAVLNSLFGSPILPLPAPAPFCGCDPTVDSLDCTTPSSACPY